ncbi:MAG: AraC family transcriptional regulator [Sphingobacteriales bacterium]|nr:MAG: AraC family transcriptional regulator [Sphingobacteriales bacterium]
MEPMKLMIKNMVCFRCIMSVESLAKEQGLQVAAVRLGELDLADAPGKEQLARFETALQKAGFELLDDQKKQLIDRLKTLLLQLVQSGSVEEHFSLSKYLSGAVHKEYSGLSRLFSEVESMTLEQYFILQKIEKVKEWLMYGEFTLSEIAWKLGYSSTQHLSNQFKKITGMTPTIFKQRGSHTRRSLDELA